MWCRLNALNYGHLESECKCFLQITSCSVFYLKKCTLLLSKPVTITFFLGFIPLQFQDGSKYCGSVLFRFKGKITIWFRFHTLVFTHEPLVLYLGQRGTIFFACRCFSETRLGNIFVYTLWNLICKQALANMHKHHRFHSDKNVISLCLPDKVEEINVHFRWQERQAEVHQA